MSATILLTGFEPFDRQPVNASWAAVQRVAAGWDDPEADLVTALLPVSFRRAPAELAVLVDRHRPDLVLGVGEAGGRSRISLERVAVNLQDARIPDEDGDQPVDRPVVPGGPVGYFAALPVKACLTAARAAGTAAEVSHTAGTYVCNTLAYAVARLVEQQADRGLRGGFVHVPRLPEQVGPGAASMTAEEAARGLSAVLSTALRTRDDLVVSAGTES